MSADRNLLFGILALQNNFVSRDGLVEALNAWVLARHRPLADLLMERGGLGQEERALLEALVDRQLARHQGDAERSLRELELSSSAHRALAAVHDADVQPSLSRVGSLSPSDRTVDRVSRPGAEELRYRVLRPHAIGGLGEVFVAEDLELHREVALKEIQERHAADAGSRGRFLLEAEITGRLEHPGIVPVYGLGCYEDGRPFYAMRFIKGDNLNSAIERFHASRAGFAGVEFRQLLRRFLDICNSVAYAHSRGVLHRDLKPGNVMLGEFGETLLVDWGLAKVVGRGEPKGGESTLRPSPGSDVFQTAAGSAIGTPGFMSPEQAEGRLEALGPATDVYSLGATLYCLLAGRGPVQGGDVAAALEKVRRGDIPPASQVRANVPKALAAICVKAMALVPGERYASALTLAQDLEHWLADEPVAAYPDPLPARAGRWARKHRTLVTTAATAMLLALASASAGLFVVGGLNGRLEAANGELTRSNAALEAARAEADEKRREAERERNVAVAVSDFLQKDLLGQADIGNQPLLGEKAERDPNITVAQLLDRASEAVEGKFAGQPETEAAIRLTIGDAYYAMGKHELAQPQLERSLALREEKLGADHPDTLTSKNNLAVLYHALEKYDQAESLFLEVLRLSEKRLGADHPDTLRSKNNLAVLYKDQGKYDRAEALHLEVLRLSEERLGADHPLTLASKNNLSALYHARGKHGQAEPLLLEVLRLREGKLGADHPDTLTGKRNLALLYRDQGKYDRAEPLHLEVLRLSEKGLGADHPFTLRSKNNLADLYSAVGKYEKAEPLFLEVVPQLEKRLGADHPDTLTGKNNLAALYWRMRKLDRSVPLFEEVLRQQTKSPGAGHPDTLRTLANLGVNYKDAGRLEEGIRRLEECLAKARSLPGGVPASLAWVPPQLADAYVRAKQFAKAEPLLLEVVGQREKKQGANHPDTLTGKNSLAEVYRDLGKYDKAEPLFLEVVRQAEKRLGADHPDTLRSKHDLAALYWRMRKLDRSVPLFEEVLRQQEKKLGTEHPYTLTTLANLGVNYRDAGRLEEGIRRLEECLAKARSLPGGVPASLAWVPPQLADAYDRAKQFAKAEPLYRGFLEDARKQFGADDPRTAGPLAQLGLNLLRQEKHAEAEKPLRDCLAIREKAQPDLWNTFNARSLLGEALLGQKKYAEAQPLLLSGYQGMKEREATIPPNSKVYLREALERVVRLYEATGDKDQAAKWRKKLEEMEKAGKEAAKPPKK
jgi:serine/threonine protein kinase/tetratricopeptide (TPR) repeat protein